MSTDRLAQVLKYAGWPEPYGRILAIRWPGWQSKDTRYGWNHV